MIHHYYDLGYAVAYEPENEAVLNFKVYELVSLEPPPLYHDGLRPTEDPAEADLLLSGCVKWDGCANFGTHEAAALMHTCSRGDIEEFGQLLLRIHEHAREHFGEGWGGD